MLIVVVSQKMRQRQKTAEKPGSERDKDACPRTLQIACLADIER